MADLRNRSKSKSNITKEKKNGNSEQVRVSSDNKLTLRVLSRIVVITSLLIVVYFSSKEDKVKVLAKQSENYEGVGQIIQCSSNQDRFEECSPSECKRFVTDKVVSIEEVATLLNIAKLGFELGESSGGASVLDLHTGALSQKESFVNMYQLPNAKHVFNQNDFKVYVEVKEKIKSSLVQHFAVNPKKIYLTHPTFFTKITNKRPVTLHDEYWHPHVDKETYMSFHYTTLLYLNDYNKDFMGGRFIFVDEVANRSVEPRSGRVSMFTSGSENMHYLEKVTSGTRYAITVAFTCDPQYAIQDPTIENFFRGYEYNNVEDEKDE